MCSVVSDFRLTPVHIALATALCLSSSSNPFRICRRELMLKSRIRSKATYHKVIKDLIRFRYIQYVPSYHPVQASEFKLLFPELNRNVSQHE